MSSNNLPVQPSLEASEAIRPLELQGSALAYAIANFAGEFWNASSTARTSQVPILVIVPSMQFGESVLSDLRFFLSQLPGEPNASDASDGDSQSRVSSIFGWEVLPFDLLSPTVNVSARRIYTMAQLAAGRSLVVLATVDALMQKVVAPAILAASTVLLRQGASMSRDALVDALDRGGYSRSSLVEEPGQLAVRGLVVDFFPPGSRTPLRAEFFANRIESLRTFDTASQRTAAALESFEVLPVREVFAPDAPSERDAAVKRLKQRASELSIAQAAVKPVEEALLTGSSWPGLEHLQPLFTPDMATLWSYLPHESPVIVCDRERVAVAASDFELLVAERQTRAAHEGRLFPEPNSAYVPAAQVQSTMQSKMVRAFRSSDITSGLLHDMAAQSSDTEETSSQSGPFPNDTLRAALRGARRLERPFQPLADEIALRRRQGFDVVLTATSSSRAARIRELLEGYEIQSGVFQGSFSEWSAARTLRNARGQVTLLVGLLSAGFRVPQEQLLIISDLELFPETKTRRQGPTAQSVRRFLGSASQLKEDDYVVHIDYGIGIYRGLRQMNVEGKVGDFLQLEYAEESKLFVPVEQIGKVQKYSGVEGKRPSLTRLGGQAWDKSKRKVQENVAELAGQLLNIMAQRELTTGVSFGPPDTDDAQFADMFPYEETADQRAAIEAVLSDMERERPMDRLVCGDVGYGKTEVALRAAFKAGNHGKQTAVLVPTTILAEQHYETFMARFAETPLRVGCVSRFYSSAENKATLEAVARGEIDIIIGTHRLLQKDVTFKDLGLVIIDEEHRFGVAHKERLKRLRSEIDILTLTATPIPRTLHMSLSGIRDLSLIETPPVNRQVTSTYIAPYESAVVREAVLRELGRTGQVFYIHNRVQTIQALADELRALIPEAKIGVAHGQMKEGELEVVMHRFIKHEIDMLVSTTIVESGLDIPNANTIIIRHADKFGLAELYQLRGRVGRSDRRAYAYLLVSDPNTLGDDAKKRLQVLKSLDDLGVGFRLALQDMEIRGAGNLLGKDQSGQIVLVGYELYSRILKDAVEELRRRRARKVDDTSPNLPIVDDPEIHIGFPAHIPPSYIPDIAERLLLYQRLIELRGEEDAEEIAAEIEDRFGTLPDEVHILVDLMALRGLLRRSGIVSANFRDQMLSLKFHKDMSVPVEKILKMVAASSGTLRLNPSGTILFSLQDKHVDRPRVLYKKVQAFVVALGIS